MTVNGGSVTLQINLNTLEVDAALFGYQFSVCGKWCIGQIDARHQE